MILLNIPKTTYGQTYVKTGIASSKNLKCKICGELVNTIEVKQHIVKHPTINIVSFTFLRH